MLISDQTRAGHVVRVKALKLAETAVAELYARQPELGARYGPNGRRYCVRDVQFHLDFLAASMELADAARFVRYVRWARGVMAAYRIAATDFLLTLVVLRD